MILVSFFSAEDVWSNDVNRYNTFSSQGTEKPPFRFFWDTQYLGKFEIGTETKAKQSILQPCVKMSFCL